MASNPLVPSPRLLKSLAHAMKLTPSSTTSRILTTCPTHRVLSSSTHRAYASQPPVPPTPQPRTPEWKHQRYRDGELIPKPLNRPLGLPYAPQPGQNTGRDTRTASERRADLASYEKHLERRRALLTSVFERNYYRDIGNLGKVHKGKSILAPSTPFRASVAQYFPNLTGLTLTGGAGIFGARDYDTTPALRGKVTIMSMINTEWANEQVRSFVGAKENEELRELAGDAAATDGLVQFATVNVEENWLKAWMIRLFWGRVRRITPREQWSTYFLNRRGLTDEIRDALGMWNSKVGYVFLLDPSCRVRWAGNGYALDEEKKSLVACVRRLVNEARGVPKAKVQREDAKPTSQSRRSQAQAATA